MANPLHFLASVAVIFLTTLVPTTQPQSFSRKLSPAALGLKEEKLTHLHFYFHDIVTSKNPTAISIIKPVANSSTFFGMVTMADDPLTMEPQLSSKLVGRAQGIYAPTSQSELALLTVLNFVFLEGKYNGSTLSVLGRNSVFSSDRDFPIVGGSGVFRFALGYAQAKTFPFDLKNGNAIVEYNVYVFHY